MGTWTSEECLVTVPQGPQGGCCAEPEHRVARWRRRASVDSAGEQQEEDLRLLLSRSPKRATESTLDIWHGGRLGAHPPPTCPELLRGVRGGVRVSWEPLPHAQSYSSPKGTAVGFAIGRESILSQKAPSTGGHLAPLPTVPFEALRSSVRSRKEAV